MSAALLELRDIHFRYPGSTALSLAGASFLVQAGQRVVFLGRNGSGKSTAFLHCNGILRPHQGAVYYDGHQVRYDRESLRILRRDVGIVFQNPDDQLFSASVAQDISFGPLNLGATTAEARQRVEQAADLCEVTHLLERPTHALSGGEKTRVALAGVLAMQPRIILADEVLASLDPWMRQQVLAIFERLVQQGTTIVLASHDIEVAKDWADWVIVMHQGRVAAAASPDSLANDDTMMQQTGLSAVWD